jgi:hypothetical protein
LCWSSPSDWVFAIGSEEIGWRVERRIGKSKEVGGTKEEPN